VAEGTVLLIEDRKGSSGSFRKERQQQRKGKDSPFQQECDPTVRRRSPS
jgi:hypothetical protein